MELKKELKSPLLISHIAVKWPCLSWTFKALSEILGSKLFSCRVSEKSCEQKMETHYIYHRITMKQFCEWLHGNSHDGPLTTYSRENYSCYIDYKYMKDLFSDIPHFFDQVQWKDFGLDDFDGYDSTVWFGSEGANTPGHQDTYGFNLVTQVYGRKLWILFPPNDSPYLYPTRIPYEESSIFTQVNLRKPNLMTHPKLKFSHPVIVILCPGQTLYVPRHWWHYVESLEPSISVNVWVPLKVDCQSHLSEAISRSLMTALIRPLDLSENSTMKDEWLNPTETLDSVDVCLTYLKTALDLYVKSEREINAEDHDQRNRREEMKEKCKVSGPAYTVKSPDSEKDFLKLLYEKLNQMTIKQVTCPFQSLSVSNRQHKRKSACGKSDAKKQKLSAHCEQREADLSGTETLQQVTKISEHDVGESEIYSLTPCSVESYMSFMDSLCQQKKCKCHLNIADLSKNTLLNNETIDISSTGATFQIISPTGCNIEEQQCSSTTHCAAKDSPAAYVTHNAQDTDLGGDHKCIETVLSSLSQLNIAENLLASVLHPDVVSILSEKFLEMCQVLKNSSS